MLRRGSVEPLSPKAFRLLELLLDRRPEAVSKSEILEQLWPDSNVSDASVHNLVAEIRAALGDQPRAARYIRTVARYGYAFRADAQQAPAAHVEISRSLRSAPSLLSKRGEWPLSKGPTDVGRDRECAVRIDSPTVSRRHARIVVTGEAATIEDLGSKNGTYVDGQRLTQPVALEDGSEIRVGSVAMIYRVLRTLPSTRTQRRG